MNSLQMYHYRLDLTRYTGGGNLFTASGVNAEIYRPGSTVFAGPYAIASLNQAAITVDRGYGFVGLDGEMFNIVSDGALVLDRDSPQFRGDITLIDRSNDGYYTLTIENESGSTVNVANGDRIVCNSTAGRANIYSSPLVRNGVKTQPVVLGNSGVLEFWSWEPEVDIVLYSGSTVLSAPIPIVGVGPLNSVRSCSDNLTKSASATTGDQTQFRYTIPRSQVTINYGALLEFEAVWTVTGTNDTKDLAFKLAPDGGASVTVASISLAAGSTGDVKIKGSLWLAATTAHKSSFEAWLGTTLTSSDPYVSLGGPNLSSQDTDLQVVADVPNAGDAAVLQSVKITQVPGTVRMDTV